MLAGLPAAMLGGGVVGGLGGLGGLGGPGSQDSPAPHHDLGVLTFAEKKFLLAVERGDVASTRR